MAGNPAHPRVTPEFPSVAEVENGRSAVSAEEQATSHSSASSAHQQTSTLSPPLGQFIIVTVLQIAAVASAIAFGVFAVKSVTVAYEANKYAVQALEQALTSNKLAFIAICLSDDRSVGQLGELCAQVSDNMESYAPSVATELFSLTPTVTATPWPSPSPLPSAGLSPGLVAGIVVGSVTAVIVCVGLIWRCKIQRRAGSQTESASRSFRKIFMDTKVVTKVK